MHHVTSEFSKAQTIRKRRKASGLDAELERFDQWVYRELEKPVDPFARRLRLDLRDEPSQPAPVQWEVRAKPEHLRQWVEGSGIDAELAAANIESLQGSSVIEALVGDRLGALGGWSDQLMTAAARKVVAPYEPLAEAGGWWCAGLDPLANWSPMAWGCFKADAPRFDADKAKPIKYEHPAKSPTRSFWLRVPSTVAQRIADRHGIPLPDDVRSDASGAAFWRWWQGELRLPLVITEGAKKAAALLTQGLPAVALPGIWNGTPKDSETQRPMLLRDLAVGLKGRRCVVIFDWSEKEKGRRDVEQAMSRLARCLSFSGADEVRVGTCPGPAKGVDDFFLAGGRWERLEERLIVPAKAPVMPAVRRPFSKRAEAGKYLGEVIPIPSPEQARLVVLRAPMGSGKTEWMADAVQQARDEGQRVVLVGHRRSLLGTLAAKFDIPWLEDNPSADEMQLGIAICLDSLCPQSGAGFRAGDYRGCTVVWDEAAQGMRHLLMGETQIAKRRVDVLEQLNQLLRESRQVLASDAQIGEAEIEALESACGLSTKGRHNRAVLIGSRHRPASGRQLMKHGTQESWRHDLVADLQRGCRLWISTTSQRASAPNSAQNLAALVLRHWPAARVLVVDSETIADPDHPAAKLALAPNLTASQYDVVIATPAIAAGLSVELQGHFDAVYAFAGGTTDPAAVAQSVARVRDGCVRHVYAPERSPGGALRVGNGATSAAAVMKGLSDRCDVIVRQLLRACQWQPGAYEMGPWLPLWAQQAALINRQALSFRATVIGLLEAEGYEVITPQELQQEQQNAAKAIGAELKAIATAAGEAEDEAVIGASLPSDEEAKALSDRRKLSPAERAQLQRYRVAKRWQLGDRQPTRELLKADREGLNSRLRFAWLLGAPEARERLVKQEGKDALLVSRSSRCWAPDLEEMSLTPQLLMAEYLGLQRWMNRSDWFSADEVAAAFDFADRPMPACGESPEESLQRTNDNRHRALYRQGCRVLNITASEKPLTTLRRLLALVGRRLEYRRRRTGQGRTAAAVYEYRVVALPVPTGTSLTELETGWLRELPLGLVDFSRVPAAGGVYQNGPHQ